MKRDEIIKKIIEKKEFSGLPEKDVGKIFSRFDKKHFTDEEKIKKTREMLMKIYSTFSIGKLLNEKIAEKKDAQEMLKKHLSTRERYNFYVELYERIFGEIKGKEISVVDLGAGINGLSYDFFPKNKKINYVGVEAIGQFVDLMNFYFKKKNIKNFSAVQGSLFDVDFVKKVLKREKGFRIVFLFKERDSLEMFERNYSKRFLSEIVPLADRFVVSFPTRSVISKVKFNAKRYWFENFVAKNFKLIEVFELGSEKYFIFENR